MNEVESAVGFARLRSDMLRRGMAPMANSFEWSWAADRQLRWR